jgi:hypothetical protein
MSVRSSGFSILPQMGHAVKGFGQLGHHSLTVGTSRGRHKCGPYSIAMNGGWVFQERI